MPYRTAGWHLWRDHRVFVPHATIQNRVEAAGEKAEPQAETGYLDWALADFSGYLAADELYDGPFCVLSAVDPHRQRRLLYEVLDHDPTRLDILCFLARLNGHIRARGHAVAGITTDGSPLYPRPVALALPAAHQVCEFHVKKELTKAVLRVLARLRKRLAEQKPAVPRGRPKNTKAAQARRGHAQAIQRRVEELFEHRHLFVRHHLDAGERAVLKRLARPDRQLRPCGRSWTRCTGCSTAAAGRTRRWAS